MNRVYITMSITSMLVLLPYIGLLMAPIQCATGFASTRAAWRDRPRVTAAMLIAIVALEFGALANRHLRLPDFGNQLSPWGAGADVAP